MTSGTVELTCLDGVATVLLNDPARKNAISAQMCRQLIEALDAAESMADVCVVRGAGGAFCGGANLIDAQSDESPRGYGLLSTHYAPLMQSIRRLRIPLVTVVEGPAAGVGMSIALSGDLVIAAEDAYFLAAFRHVGLVPDGGLTSLLTNTVGRVRAAEITLLGEPLPATTAHQWGLVTRVVAGDEIDELLDSLLDSLTAGATEALGQTRRLLWSATELSFAQQFGLETEAQEDASRSADHREGIAAFLERRSPQFHSRRSSSGSPTSGDLP